jgi:A/G-specific adenine glycosylase
VIELLDQFLPMENSHKPFEALIELGATVCTKKPKCTSCPLMGNCKAFNEELTDVIPVVKPKAKVEKITRIVFVIEVDGAILVKKESKKLMNGLYEFPYVETGSCAADIKMMEQLFSCKLEKVQEYKEVVHFFTKYRASLYPIQCRVSGSICLPTGYELVCKERLGDYPFSAGHRKILHTIVFAR